MGKKTEAEEELGFLTFVAANLIDLYTEDNEPARPSHRLEPELMEEEEEELMEDHSKGAFAGPVKFILNFGTDEDIMTFAGMRKTELEHIFGYVRPLLTTNTQDSVSRMEKFMCTLNYLRSGVTLNQLSLYWLIPHTTLGRYVREVCLAIIKILEFEADCRPQNSSDWERVADDFNRLWNLPNCLGAFGGKHVAVNKYATTGSEQYNYKGYISTILLAVVDAQYRIIHFNIGNPGARNDGRVFFEDNLGTAIREKTLDIPPPKPLPKDRNNEIGPVGHYFIADDAFPSGDHLVQPLNPVPRRPLSNDEICTNDRIYLALSTVDCVFGHLTRRFGILKLLVIHEEFSINLIIKTCVHIHNYIRLVRKDELGEINAIKDSLSVEPFGVPFTKTKTKTVGGRVGGNVGGSVGVRRSPRFAQTVPDVGQLQKDPGHTRSKLHLYFNTVEKNLRDCNDVCFDM